MPDSALNVDAAEVAKFDAMAARWWDPQGEMRPLHEINPLRAAYIANAVELDNAHCLDVGCGAGLLTEELARLGAVTTGIDASEAALQVGRMHAGMSGVEITYTCITAEEFAQRSAEATQQHDNEPGPGHNLFDVVTCMELLEHVPDPSSLISACARLTRPGGHLFFSTINRNLKAYLMAIVGAEYILNMLPRGTHDYEKLIKPSELARMGREADLVLEDVTGIEFAPLSGGFKLGGDPSVNYLVRFSRPAR